MKQLYVRLQTPVIELTVKAKDSSGANDKIVVGFKRYNLEEAEKQLKEFQEVIEQQLEDMQEGTAISEEVNSFIKDKVVYIKQAKLEIYDTEADKTVELVIPDTRKAKPNEDFWESPDECLDALLDLYLSAAPWRSSLITALQKALLNMDYEAEQLKNS